jgi:hypothetical protein
VGTSLVFGEEFEPCAGPSELFSTRTLDGWLALCLRIDLCQTATRWAGYAKRDWQTYLADRRETAPHLKVDAARQP